VAVHVDVEYDVDDQDDHDDGKDVKNDHDLWNFLHHSCGGFCRTVHRRWWWIR